MCILSYMDYSCADETLLVVWLFPTPPPSQPGKLAIRQLHTYGMYSSNYIQDYIVHKIQPSVWKTQALKQFMICCKYQDLEGWKSTQL